MSDVWREYLYIPLGVVPALFFGLRWVVQWLQSERVGRPTSSTSFWWLSLTGNVLLATHYIVQVQFPFAVLQALNGVISSRLPHFWEFPLWRVHFLGTTPSIR